MSINAFSQKEITGKLTAGDSVEIGIKYILPKDFPSIEVLFQAENSNGYPYWGLEINDFEITENNKLCEVLYLNHYGRKKPINISLVLDHSGSMNQSFSDIIDFLGGDTNLYFNPTDSIIQAYNFSGKRPIDNLNKAVSNFIEKFDFSKDKVGVFGFSSTVDIVLPLNNDKQKIKSAIDSMHASGSTAFYDAVFKALSNTPVSEDINIIVAITDGGDNSSTKNTKNIIELANSKNIPIYCIGLGDVYETPLLSISDSTNGFYVYTKKSSSLDSIYDLINKKIQAIYELGYTSDNWSNDTLRNFNLKFKTENITQLDSGFKFSLPSDVIEKINERNRIQTLKIIGITGGVTTVLLVAVGIAYFRRKKKDKIKIVRMYPNPGNGFINLELIVPKNVTEVNLKVVTPNGSIVLQENISVNQKTLDLRKMNQGLYIINISKDGYNTVSKKYFKR